MEAAEARKRVWTSSTTAIFSNICAFCVAIGSSAGINRPATGQDLRCATAHTPAELAFRECRLFRLALVGHFGTRGRTGGLWRLDSVPFRRIGELSGQA
jgi:hypothetical protein